MTRREAEKERCAQGGSRRNEGRWAARREREKKVKKESRRK